MICHRLMIWNLRQGECTISYFQQKVVRRQQPENNSKEHYTHVFYILHCLVDRESEFISFISIFVLEKFFENLLLRFLFKFEVDKNLI